MQRLKTYRHRTFQTPSGRRLLAYARGRLVMAGPEEMVRQDVVRSLVEEYGYPRDCVVAEEPVARETENRRRADVLVRLPRATLGEATLGKTLERKRAAPASYRRAASRVRDLLSGVGSLHVPEMPRSFLVEFDGQTHEMTLLGFGSADLNISLVLAPEEGVLPDAPSPIVTWVLGHGLTGTEERVARALSLPSLAPTDPGSSALASEVDYLLQLMEGPEAWVTGALSADGFDGWVLVRHADEPLNVLVHATTRGDDWATSVNRAAEAAKQIPLHDGRMAERAGLESLEVGARVVVETTEGKIVEGVVERIDGQTVFVQSSDQTLAAETRLTKESNWLLGAVADDAGLSADTDGGDAAGGDLSTLLVVECKAPGVPITQEVVSQGVSYAETAGATFVVATNGVDTQCYLRRAGGLTLVDDIPSYETVCASSEYEVDRAQVASAALEPLPTSARERPELTILHGRSRGSIGADVAARHWWPVLKLQDSLIHGQWQTGAPYSGYGVEILEDMGLRFHSAGNAGGGIWSGFYRDLLIRDPLGDERVMALMVMATRKTVGDPHWGNRRGRSQLIVTLSRDTRFESQLQVDLAQSLELEANDDLLLRHSGRMSAGRGAVKIKEVLEHVAKSVPALVDGGRVDLGRLPSRGQVEWPDVTDMLARIGGYAAVREQLKSSVKARRRRDC